MRNRDGFALEATMMVLVLMTVLMLAAYNGAVTATKSANLDYRAARVSYAAEGGADAILAQLADALEDGLLEDGELASVTPPEVEGFTFSAMTVEKIGGVEVETVTDGPFAGLYSLTQRLEITSEAVDPYGNSSSIIVSAKAQAFPIFQFGVFFERDLEATNGPSMEFAGWVHSNGNIYLSSNNAWYRDIITTPNKVFHDRKDNHSVKNGVYINDASANEVMLDFDSRTHPSPAAFRTRSNTRFDNRLKTDAYDVDSLKLPLPAGVDASELLAPRDPSDGELARAAKFAWKADMYVTVDLDNLVARSATCPNTPGANLPPSDVASGDINLSYMGTSGLCPGQTVTFTASHPLLTCAEFDNRALLTIDADAWVTSNGMNGCQFDVTLPAGMARDFKIKIEIRAPDYTQLNTDLVLDVVWYKEDIAANCGPGMGAGGNKTLAEDPYPNITVTRTGGLVAPVKDDICAIFPFEWSAFYEGREMNMREILNIDIQQLSGWAAVDPNRVTRQIYVEFIVPNGTAGYVKAAKDSLQDGSVDASVRLKNGSQLPNPLSVATHYPLYVQGNYNSGTWQPAALVGDAISILSNRWNDADHQAQRIVRPNASNTEVYGAILAGHSATPCDHEDAGCAGGYTDFYGGGIENFPRFLERWSGITLKYVGALVSIHVSQHAVGTWSGRPYSPPRRDWSFDTRFDDPQNLPPGTPVVGNIIHTAFRPVY